jgi:hypothetical protein
MQRLVNRQIRKVCGEIAHFDVIIVALSNFLEVQAGHGLTLEILQLFVRNKQSLRRLVMAKTLRTSTINATVTGPTTLAVFGRT